jgi:hypothetical protein
MLRHEQRASSVGYSWISLENPIRERAHAISTRMAASIANPTSIV